MIEDFEQSMLAYLITGSSSLFALQGNRVHPAPLPEGRTFPATTFQKIPGGEHVFVHSGHSGLIDCRYQFNCWGSTKKQAREVADALIDTLGHWTGTSSYVLDDFDDYETDTKLHRVIVDTELWREP